MTIDPSIILAVGVGRGLLLVALIFLLVVVILGVVIYRNNKRIR